MDPQLNMPNKPAAFSSQLMLIISAFVLIALSGGTGYYLGSQKTNQLPATSPPVIVSATQAAGCTDEAILCPDGSSVARIPPSCEFAECPGSSTPSLQPQPTIEESLTPNCCSNNQAAQGYECLAKCGPPIEPPDGMDKQPSPSYQCLSPESVKARKEFGCPICLSSHTLISTPDGEIPVTDLHTGILVWTVDAKGNKVAQPIVETSKVAVPAHHTVVHLILSDKREVWVSPGHPTEAGTPVGNLKKGDIYDRAHVSKTERVLYDDNYTYDLLPAGATGYYWANGILLGSTLHQ